MNEFGGVGDEMFEFAVDGVYGEDGVFTDVGVSMLEARSTDRN